MISEILFMGCYGLIMLLLTIYGYHRGMLVWLYQRHKKDKPVIKAQFNRLPRVTVQLPVYNELYVAERIVDAAVNIDYPRELLDIQVLDDSTDETQEILKKKITGLQDAGIDIHYIHRSDRTGFKAGALENGLKSAKGDFILIFDADFVPKPGVIKEMIHFFTDHKVGMVQARWTHLNFDDSPLTRVQTMMLDGHFILEHTARSRSGRFFNFNGTAGVWRRTAIEDAGGWQHDTLTEDMDLSYRAQLKGWRFIYLKDVEVPAELPSEMNAFKSQQFRWAKGSIQVACKLLPEVMRSNATTAQKIETFFHLTNNAAYPLLLMMSILILPCLLLSAIHGWREIVLIDIPIFFGTTVSVATFYLTTQQEEGSRSIWWALKRLPVLFAVGIGLCVNQTRAVLEALFGHSSEFIRTPKVGRTGSDRIPRKKGYTSTLTLVPFIEITMAIYFVFTFITAYNAQRYASLPFVFLFFCGFAYVGGLSMMHSLRSRTSVTKPTGKAILGTVSVSKVLVGAQLHSRR
ncbi:MAG: cellulose synthase family protein [Thermodesulfobacteriota bacterium]